MPAAVCSTISENLDEETRDFLVAHGVAPMQGIDACMTAIAGAVWHGARRAEITANTPAALVAPLPAVSGHLMDEDAAKKLLASSGIAVPRSLTGSGSEISGLAQKLGFPVALKMVSARLPHKTEAGAVKLGLRSSDEVTAAVQRMRADVTAFNASALTDVFLAEAMVASPVAELMVSIRRDPQFGLAMTLAAGGILVELLEDARTVLLPAARSDMERALSRLKMSRLLDGYRGRPAANRQALLDTLERLATFAVEPKNRVIEVEINPLFVGSDASCAVDVLMQIG